MSNLAHFFIFLILQKKQSSKKENTSLNIYLNTGETLIYTSELLINRKHREENLTRRNFADDSYHISKKKDFEN